MMLRVRKVPSRLDLGIQIVTADLFSEHDVVARVSGEWRLVAGGRARSSRGARGRRRRIRRGRVRFLVCAKGSHASRCSSRSNIERGLCLLQSDSARATRMCSVSLSPRRMPCRAMLTAFQELMGCRGQSNRGQGVELEFTSRLEKSLRTDAPARASAILHIKVFQTPCAIVASRRAAWSLFHPGCFRESPI